MSPNGRSTANAVRQLLHNSEPLYAVGNSPDCIAISASCNAGVVFCFHPACIHASRRFTQPPLTLTHKAAVPQPQRHPAMSHVRCSVQPCACRLQFKGSGMRAHLQLVAWFARHHITSIWKGAAGMSSSSIWNRSLAGRDRATPPDASCMPRHHIVLPYITYIKIRLRSGTGKAAHV